MEIPTKSWEMVIRLREIAMILMAISTTSKAPRTM